MPEILPCPCGIAREDCTYHNGGTEHDYCPPSWDEDAKDYSYPRPVTAWGEPDEFDIDPWEEDPIT